MKDGDYMMPKIGYQDTKGNTLPLLKVKFLEFTRMEEQEN
jgi:hypothetical protein